MSPQEQLSYSDQRVWAALVVENDEDPNKRLEVIRRRADVATRKWRYPT